MHTGHPTHILSLRLVPLQIRSVSSSSRSRGVTYVLTGVHCRSSSTVGKLNQWLAKVSVPAVVQKLNRWQWTRAEGCVSVLFCLFVRRSFSSSSLLFLACIFAHVEYSSQQTLTILYTQSIHSQMYAEPIIHSFPVSATTARLRQSEVFAATSAIRKSHSRSLASH